MTVFKAVFFDFDNTIVKQKEAQALSIKSLLKLLSVEIPPDEFLEVTWQKLKKFHFLVREGREQRRNLYRYPLLESFRHFNLPWEEGYLDIFSTNYIEATEFFPGALEFFLQFKGQIKLAILSNAYSPKEQNLKLDKLNFWNYVDDVVLCSELGHYKPSPEAYLYLVHKYSYEPSSCIFVGDSEEFDVRGAKEVGFYAVKLTQGLLDEGPSLADYICDDFYQLADFLKERLR